LSFSLGDTLKKELKESVPASPEAPKETAKPIEQPKPIEAPAKTSINPLQNVVNEGVPPVSPNWAEIGKEGSSPLGKKRGPYKPREGKGASKVATGKEDETPEAVVMAADKFSGMIVGGFETSLVMLFQEGGRFTETERLQLREVWKDVAVEYDIQKPPVTLAAIGCTAGIVLAKCQQGENPKRLAGIWARLQAWTKGKKLQPMEQPK
jgi:hypothetical protein